MKSPPVMTSRAKFRHVEGATFGNRRRRMGPKSVTMTTSTSVDPSGVGFTTSVVGWAVSYVRNAMGDTGGTKTQNLAVTVTIYHSSDPGTPVQIDASQASALDLIVVEVKIPYADVRWINLPMLTSASTLKGQATWLSLKNFPFPTSPPQPPTG